MREMKLNRPLTLSPHLSPSPSLSHTHTHTHTYTLTITHTILLSQTIFLLKKKTTGFWPSRPEIYLNPEHNNAIHVKETATAQWSQCTLRLTHAV